MEYLFDNKFRFLWGKLYRKSCFADYEVPNCNHGEDSIVNAQIFAHIEYVNITIVSDIVYFYNRVHNTMSTFKRIKYKSILDYPFVESRLWIEEYLKKNKLIDTVGYSFLKYILCTCFYSFLRFAVDPKKEDIEYIYINYYLPYPQKSKLPFLFRTLLQVYAKSLFMGKIYASVLFFLNRIKYLQIR